MIKRGDTVKLLYTDGESILVEIVHTPQGDGDSWHVRSQAGTMMLVNVYCGQFVGMFKERDAIPCTHCASGSFVWDENEHARVCRICGRIEEDAPTD